MGGGESDEGRGQGEIGPGLGPHRGVEDCSKGGGGSDLVTFAVPGAWPGLVPCPELRRAFRVGDVVLRPELESRAGCEGPPRLSSVVRSAFPRPGNTSFCVCPEQTAVLAARGLGALVQLEERKEAAGQGAPVSRMSIWVPETLREEAPARPAPARRRPVHLDIISRVQK